MTNFDVHRRFFEEVKGVIWVRTILYIKIGRPASESILSDINVQNISLYTC